MLFQYLLVLWKYYTPPTQCQLKSKNYVILPFSLVNKYLGQETGSCLGSFDTGVNYLQLIAAHLIDGHRINAVIHLMDFQFIIRHWRIRNQHNPWLKSNKCLRLIFSILNNFIIFNTHVDDLVSAQVWLPDQRIRAISLRTLHDRGVTQITLSYTIGECKYLHNQIQKENI